MIFKTPVAKSDLWRDSGSAPTDNNRLDAECFIKIFVPLKYLNNFRRSLDLPLINWEIELNLSLSITRWI